MPFQSSQIDLLEKALDRQYVELLKEVREELRHIGEGEYVQLLGRVGADAAEEAVRDLLWGLNANLFDRHICAIREIEEARDRIRDGAYGVCVACGEDMTLERLQSQPTASRCDYCQRQHERTDAIEATSNM
ncbi:MAG: TraR/DksA C4-type zinc finger protein [Betaproteobacteria bacterium]|jgi:DnaK suppressor protein|nr:MAG: TraR/DksA C4-type zinc finger protein [Betaproteobacteria bacterium]